MIRRIVKLPGNKLNKYKKTLTEQDWQQLEKDEYVIGISASQMTVWLDELRGTTTEQLEQEHSELRRKQRLLKKQQQSQIEILQQIRKIEFIPDLIQVEYKNDKQFKEKFKFNGQEFTWINSKGDSTNTYIRSDLEEAITTKMHNGRDKSVKFIPAKLNAYLGLTLSSSRPIQHQPKHIVVVADAKSTFEATYKYVSTNGVHDKTEEVTLEASDGNGVIDYKLLELWEQDMGYGKHKSSGVSIRNAFIKGMVFPIDLQEFFTEHEVTEIVDVWGNRHSIADIDLIIPTSMFKLWQSYKSYDEYDKNCKLNGYQFRVCKETHSPVSSSPRTNYQMTTDLQMSDNQIERFITPTIDWLKDVAGRDWLSTVLYLNGQDLTEDTLDDVIDGSIAKAIMICPELIKDKSVALQVNRQLRRRKNDACLGRYNLETNYQVLSTDLYFFLTNACGIKGEYILNAGEVYSQWHADNNYKEALLFRSPMISKENIAKVKLVDNEKLRKFYKYCPYTVHLNDLDLIRDTLAGADADGDSLLVVTDEVLLEVFEPVLPCRCQTYEDGAKKITCDNKNILMDGAKLGCSNTYNIGALINEVTSQFSIRSRFEPKDEEYQELSDRILMGLMYSQSYIDAKKLGGALEPPKHWFDLKECEKLDCSEEEKLYQKSICTGGKKPYFMKYQPQATDTRKLCKNIQHQFEFRAGCLWGLTLKELLKIPVAQRTEDQKNVIEYWQGKYPHYMMDDSVQHRMCLATEEALKNVNVGFNQCQDCSELLKYNNIPVDKDVEAKITGLLFEYKGKMNLLHNKKRFGDKDKIREAFNDGIKKLREELRADILDLCSDKKVAINSLINVAYEKRKNNTLTGIVWDLFGQEIIENLLEKNNYWVQIPVQDEHGDKVYRGKRFTIVEKQIRNLEEIAD